MANPLIIPFDAVVQGNLVVTGNFSFSAGTVTDTSVAAAAGIGATKLQHSHEQGYAQESATNAATESRVVFKASGAGTVNAFVAGAVVLLTGNDTCTIDLKKNGTTVLSAPIALSSSDTSRVAKTGTVTSAAFVAGDVFEVVITATHNTGTLPKGVFASGQFFAVTQ